MLDRYCDGIMIRTFAQEEVENLANYTKIPVINGLTDFCHPCQVLADLMTVREHKAILEGDQELSQEDVDILWQEANIGFPYSTVKYNVVFMGDSITQYWISASRGNPTFFTDND